MKCIDAIEGMAKCIIVKLHQDFAERSLDDTEYIKNIKSVIEGADMFIRDNREILHEPMVLRQVLYDFSKALWLKNSEKIRGQGPDAEDRHADPEQLEYDEYYFDYIYNHGGYPR